MGIHMGSSSLAHREYGEIFCLITMVTGTTSKKDFLDACTKLASKLKTCDTQSLIHLDSRNNTSLIQKIIYLKLDEFNNSEVPKEFVSNTLLFMFVSILNERIPDKLLILLNNISSFKFSVLQSAVITKNQHNVEYLIELLSKYEPAEINNMLTNKTRQGNMVLINALEKNNREIFEPIVAFLEKNTDALDWNLVNINTYSNTVLHAAFLAGDEHCINRVIELIHKQIEAKRLDKSLIRTQLERRNNDTQNIVSIAFYGYKPRFIALIEDLYFHAYGNDWKKNAISHIKSSYLGSTGNRSRNTAIQDLLSELKWCDSHEGSYTPGYDQVPRAFVASKRSRDDTSHGDEPRQKKFKHM